MFISLDYFNLRKEVIFDWVQTYYYGLQGKIGRLAINAKVS